MNRKIGIVAVAAVVAFGLFYGVRHVSRPADAPELCHLFNEGFSVRSGETMVLMDAFAREGFPEDQPAPQGLMEALEAASLPYDGVDLITVSHKHIDHFSASALAAHMRANPDAQLLLPKEAEAEFFAGTGDEFEGRVQGITPERGVPMTVVAGGIPVTVYNLDHRTEVENVGVFFELGGKTFFHAGDFMSADFEANGVEGLAVDYLLIPYWYFLDEADREQYLTRIDARYIVPMHMPVREAELKFIDERGGWEKVMEGVRKTAPNILWLFDPGACVRAVG